VIRRTASAALVIVVMVAAACASAATSAPSRISAPSVSPATERPPASVPPLPDAAAAWCLAHLGEVGPDQHRVEDMAIVNRLIAGASTPAEVSSRWAGLTSDQLRRDPAFVPACLAAYAASSAVPS
jgi:hypothetical protein